VASSPGLASREDGDPTGCSCPGPQLYPLAMELRPKRNAMSGFFKCPACQSRHSSQLLKFKWLPGQCRANVARLPFGSLRARVLIGEQGGIWFTLPQLCRSPVRAGGGRGVCLPSASLVHLVRLHQTRYGLDRWERKEPRLRSFAGALAAGLVRLARGCCRTDSFDRHDGLFALRYDRLPSRRLRRLRGLPDASSGFECSRIRLEFVVGVRRRSL
jgi:hypothetical protein